MARKSIFDIISEKWDIKIEVKRLRHLYEESHVIEHCWGELFTLKSFVDSHCFNNWRNRYSCIDVDDYLRTLEFDKLIKNAPENFSSLLLCIEIIYNFYDIATWTVLLSAEFNFTSNFRLLRENIELCLEHYNHQAHHFKEKQQVIITEKDPAATAAAEISDPETAYEIIRYNHHALKGDIAEKKKILLHLGSELEPKRKVLEDLNPPLEDGIFTLLNNANLRHNNCDSSSPKYKEYIATMSGDDLEEWYDELYQMILLAKLELDHIERKVRIDELKANL
jgi:hypothetical protein